MRFAAKRARSCALCCVLVACATTPEPSIELERIATRAEFICFAVEQMPGFKDARPDDYATLARYIKDSNLTCTPEMVLEGAKIITAYGQRVRAERQRAEAEAARARAATAVSEQRAAERRQAFADGAVRVLSVVFDLAAAYVVGRAAIEASRSQTSLVPPPGPLTCSRTPNGTTIVCNSGGGNFPTICNTTPNGLSMTCRTTGGAMPMTCNMTPNGVSVTCR